MAMIEGIFELFIKGESQQKFDLIYKAHLDLVLVIFCMTFKLDYSAKYRKVRLSFRGMLGVEFSGS